MNNDVDVKLQMMRERLAQFEKKVLDMRRKNETKVKCDIATALLKKLELDELTKMLDKKSQCERFCSYIADNLLVKIVVTKEWSDDVKKYIDEEND